jgi:hypothetical protein
VVDFACEVSSILPVHVGVVAGETHRGVLWPILRHYPNVLPNPSAFFRRLRGEQAVPLFEWCYLHLRVGGVGFVLETQEELVVATLVPLAFAGWPTLVLVRNVFRMSKWNIVLIEE